MVCSAEVWAGRGPSPARKRRDLENSPPTPLHAAAAATPSTQPSSSSVGFSTAAGGGGGGWRRPLPSSASINVRLLDAAVQVFAACFGQQVCLCHFVCICMCVVFFLTLFIFSVDLFSFIFLTLLFFSILFFVNFFVCLAVCTVGSLEFSPFIL